MAVWMEWKIHRSSVLHVLLLLHLLLLLLLLLVWYVQWPKTNNCVEN